MKNEVILVDYNDKELGRAEKMEAHEKALLHRAFSVFLFDGRRILLQKRALSKYHCPGLWTNSCCSHPQPGELTVLAARRRLREELGSDYCSVDECFSFFYRYPFSNGLTEFECDHVFIGQYSVNAPLSPDPEEVCECRWWDIDELKKAMTERAEEFTPWFLICAPRAIGFIEERIRPKEKKN